MPLDGKEDPIDEMLLCGITKLKYQGRDPAEEFVSKDQDREICRT